MIALNLAYLVSGVVIVETIFSYPGLAKLMVDAVQTVTCRWFRPAP